MNDFDFEELDKAVNTLASKTREEHDTPDAPVVKPANTPPASSVPRQDSQSVPVVSKQPKTRSRSAQRGSFMDIVPPSPRKTTNTRVGPTLQPVSRPEDIVPSSQVEPPKEDKKEPETAPAATSDAPQPSKPENRQPEAPQKSETSGDVSWPDPLDFHDVDRITQDVPKKPNEDRSSSPFLAEAKVEKRPLGAFSTFAQTSEQPKPAEATPKELSSKPEPKPDPEAVDELTPEESGLFKEPETPPDQQKSESASDSQPTEDKPEPEIEKKEPSKPDMHSKAMMSIPQQYRTERKTADKTTHSVFDTKEYHPPLLEAAIPEHHRGGGVWTKLFVAFVVLVLLGVSGYFVYIFMFAQS